MKAQLIGLLVWWIFLSLSVGWFLPTFRPVIQPRRGCLRHRQFLMRAKEDVDELEKSYQATTDVVGSLVFQAWSRTTKLISPHVLSQCENDVKGVMSLFVLASFRKSAEEYGSSKRALEWMLKTADVNSDGELTFIEWFDWLQQYSSGPGLYENPSNELLGEDPSFAIATINQRSSSAALDPMVIKLGRVLGCAMSTLSNYARMTTDPVLLTAAYAAGGMSTGLLDAAVVQSMLGRLNDRVRLVVMRSIAAEATRTVQFGSMNSVSAGGGTGFGSPRFSLRGSTNSSSRLSNNQVNFLPSTSPPSVSKPTSELQTEDTVLLNLKWLNRIPDPAIIKQAPPIFDSTPSTDSNIMPPPSLSVEEQLLKAIDNALLGHDTANIINDFLPNKDARLTAMGTITTVEAQLDLLDNTTNAMGSIQDDANDANNENNDQQILAVRELFTQEIQDFTRIMTESAQLQGSLTDLDDPQASLIRQSLFDKTSSLGAESKVVLGLALSIRSARLQNLDSLPINRFWRQQLALETIQVWSPISYQLELAPYTPELEIHSYVHLFPTSFAEFLSWYNNFRPLARKVIETFNQQFSARVRENGMLREYCSKIIIQSRLKTPPSAFKKMVRGAKVINQLYDIVGIRIITVARDEQQPSHNNNNNNHNHKNNNQVDFWENKESTGEQGEGQEEEETTTVNIPPIIITPTTAVTSSSQQQTIEHIEQQTMSCIRSIITSMTQWEEETQRFKDYISAPKASGYQSIHTSLLHKPTGIRMELQLRSDRMHWIAEYGSASHNNYKALLLPQNAGQ